MRRRVVLRTALALVAVPLFALPSMAQDVEISSEAMKIRIGGRVQMQARRSTCSEFPVEPPCDEEVRTVNWFIRRARIEFTVNFNDFIEGKFAPEFAPAAEALDATNLTDAYGQLNFSDAAHLRLGHFKRPFDGFQLASSTQILTIERDIDIPGVPSDVALSLDEFTESFNLSNRNVGVQLNGEITSGEFEYWVGVFNGNSASDNEGETDGKQYMGRVQLGLEVGGLPLALAAAGAVTELPFTRASGQLAGVEYGNLELWAELGDYSGGPHVQAELFYGGNPLEAEAGGPPDLAAGDRLATAWATQVIGAWRFPIRGSRVFDGVEPVFRATYADPNTDLGGAVWGLTPGVQLFFASRQKIAVNWDFALFTSDLRSVNSFKAQYQFYF